MKTQLGLTSIELGWFESYLMNREQVCNIIGQSSSPKKIITGVPQGSILGPLLFLLYINDLPECLSKTTPCLYADDTQIFASSTVYADLIEKLNSDLNQISKWLAINKLQHHPTKNEGNDHWIGTKSKRKGSRFPSNAEWENDPFNRLL